MSTKKKGAILLSVIFLGLPTSIFAQAPIRVESSYEDSLRIVVLWNHVEGLCEGTYTSLIFPLSGIDTRNFVLRAIDTIKVPNVKVFQSASFSSGLRYPVGGVSSATTLKEVQKAFGRMKYPHVIVHINAGHTAFNGPNMKQILDWAVANGIGVVEIGDDGATLAETVFGVKKVNNYPPPIEDAIWLDKSEDSLKIYLQTERDLIKEVTKFPYLNGLISNACKLNLQNRSLYFKPFKNNGRCQADADTYTIPAGKKHGITFLGFEQGYNANIDSSDKAINKIIGKEDQYNVIVHLQDTVLVKANRIIRRGVILSFQPQFLENEAAAQQLVYDAVIYSSLLHLHRRGSGKSSKAFKK